MKFVEKLKRNDTARWLLFTEDDHFIAHPLVKTLFGLVLLGLVAAGIFG